VGHVAYMGSKGMYTGLRWGKHEGRNHCEELGIEVLIILKWILKL
jgi:hypothetical protein